MAANPEIGVNPRECGRHPSGIEQVIERVEVRRDQVDRVRQVERTDILTKQRDMARRAVADSLTQHGRRAIDSKDGYPPAAAKIKGEEAGAAAEISGRAELDPIPAHQRLKRRTAAGEARQSEEAIVAGGKTAVRRPRHHSPGAVASDHAHR